MTLYMTNTQPSNEALSYTVKMLDPGGRKQKQYRMLDSMIHLIEKVEPINYMLFTTGAMSWFNLPMCSKPLYPMTSLGSLSLLMHVIPLWHLCPIPSSTEQCVSGIASSSMVKFELELQ